MTHPVTRGELREELGKMREEMREEMRAEFPTKQYVDDMAKMFFDALVRLEARTDARFEKQTADLMRHMNALHEAVRAEIRAITEPYQDHGPRIERLERAVFPGDGGGGTVTAKARVRRRTRSR